MVAYAVVGDHREVIWDWDLWPWIVIQGGRSVSAYDALLGECEDAVEFLMIEIGGRLAPAIREIGVAAAEMTKSLVALGEAYQAAFEKEAS